MRRLAVLSLVLCGGVAWSQPVQRPASFEAASVHQSQGKTGFKMAGGPGTDDPGQITYSSVTLEDLILKAYDVRPYQLRGRPSWLNSERFAIVAKVPTGASKDDLRTMLQGLLADRFKLAVHRETEEGRNYSLVVDKGGPKLKAADKPPEHGTIETDPSGSLAVAPNAMGHPVTLGGSHIAALVSGGLMSILANSQPVSALAEILGKFMDGPVVDLTGLTGKYDFTLSFTPPAGMLLPQMGPPGDCPTCAPSEDVPTLFQAVKEKLGLRLDSNRGPVNLLVIDHAEKVPTEN
jgi:uncharacterized protein (TIGR03435 family)